MAQLDQELKIADVYAEALFSLAEKQNAVADVRAELDELLKLWESEAEFMRFMSSPAIGGDGREAGLEKIFSGRLSEIVLHTLLVMNQHGRTALLPALHRRYELRQENAANEVEVDVTSVIELQETEQKKLVKLAKKISGKEPIMRYHVDPEILGGLIMKVGSLRLDDSAATHLEAARNQLVLRAERGLKIATIED